MRSQSTSQPRHAALPSRLRSALSPRDVLFVLFRHGRAVAAVFLLVATAAAAVAALLPDVYKSEAKMLVRLGRESVTLDPTATIGTTVQPIQTRKSEINSELELLKSRGLAEAVVTRITPLRILKETAASSGAAPLVQDAVQARSAAVAAELLEAKVFADAVLKVMEEVKVEVVPDSNVLYVAYSASDPVRARDIVAAYVDEYLDLRLRVYRNPDGQAFFANQHDRSQRQLDVLQQQIRQLKDRTGLADITTQRTILLTRIGALRSAYDDARTTLASSKATVDQLRSSLESMPDSVVTSRTTNAPNSSVETLRQRLAELRIDEQDISSRYVADSPTVVTIKAKVREAEKLLTDAEQRAQETTGPNANREAMALRLQGVLADVAAGEARVTQVRADLAKAEGGLNLLNQTQVTLDDLQRQAAVAEANVSQYAKVLEVSRVDTALETNKISNISLYQPAKLPLEPEGPKRKLLLVVGLLLATLAAGGTAFALEALDHTVKRPEDLRLIGARIDHVVSVPKLTSGSAVAKHFGDHFDDFRDGLSHLFGTAGRTTARQSGAASASLTRMVVLLPLAALGALLRLGRDLTSAARLSAAILRRNHLTPATVHATADGGLSLHDSRHTFTGGRIVAEHEALQDLDDDERPDVEPRAEPDHKFLHTLRLVAYGVRRDVAARWRRDNRPNLQLADRRHRTAAAEAMWVGARALFEQVMLETDPGGTGEMPRTVAVVACRADSGTTTVAAHLAGVMAERVNDSLDPTADVDPTQPRGVLLMALPVSSRIADDSGGELRPRATPVKNLSRTDVTTLNTGLIRAAVDRALKKYAHVVLDLPPVFNDVRGHRYGEVREDAGPRLAGLCQTSVMVVEAETLRREAAGQALQQLDRAGASPACVVLNKRSYPIPQWIYKRA